MGEVYVARDEVLGRKVALKVLRPEVFVSAGGKERFLREARAIAALNHPGIAVLYEAGEADGRPYLAMEYIAGRSLKDELAGGPLPLARLTEYAGQLAEALDHAHRRGILHRDIKSANVYLSAENTIKLLDFGLAKAIQESEETKSQLTAPDTWVGTLHYCPPEVLAGRSAGVRSDIYSLGVVLYEMATGLLPFAGLEGNALVAAILRGSVPPLRQRNPAVPAALSQIIERAMASHAEQRFARASELVSALREIESGKISTAAEPTAAAPPSMAVLEFQNISGDASMDWLGTGLAETLTTDLKKVKRVRVVSREKVQEAKRRRGQKEDEAAGLHEIGRELGVRWLVTGSFQRAGDRLRITPRLLEVETGEVVATSKIDGNWQDVFALQDRVVSELMSAVQVNLDSSDLERIAAPETLRLEAYQHFVQGRIKHNEFGKNSLEEARQHFERAIALDPQYAMAHSALGFTYAMRYIHRTDSEDLTRALGYLERALEIDPELGDPYPYLCYVYMRQGKLDQAIAAGQKGVNRQPDLVYSHYFLACAYMIGEEIGRDGYQAAVQNYLKGTEVEPQYFADWLNLGWVALMAGEYEHAERFLMKSLELERSGRAFLKGFGAEALLGSVWLRRGQWEKARETNLQSLKSLESVDSVYREAFMANSACGLGDIDLRERKPEAALAEFRKAFRICKEFPRMLGNDRALIRAQAGMAAAYAALGDRASAQSATGEAVERLDRVSNHPETWVWELSVPQLSYALATAYRRLEDAGHAFDLLEHAVATGWRDPHWLENDPEMGVLRDHPRFQKLLADLRNRPALNFAPRKVI